MLNDEQILEIRQKADIVDIVSDYISVVNKGKNHFAVCPFHDDHNPSMVVSREKQIFNCFTCHTGGNVFTFVMKYENVGFVEAVKIVADKVGVSLNVKNFESTSKYKEDYDLMNISKKLYINNINTKSGLNAKKYLVDRGISENIINDFDIGLSLNEPKQLTEFLTKQGYEINKMESLGLTGKNGIDIYDLFRNRIMIPITNLRGETVGFTGRIYNNEDSAKYINTKETHIFKKGHILFNYYNAKNHIREEKSVIIVEGNMDAIKMSASGIKNVIALMGTALTSEQVEVIKKLNTKVILLFDNDNAGLEATLKNGDILLEKRIVSEVVRLSDAKDPDEYINKFGIKALLDNLNHPINYIDYKINFLKTKYDINSADGLANFVKEILNGIKNVDDLSKNIILDKISKDYNVDKNILINEAGSIKKEIKPVLKKDVYIKKNKYRTLANIILYYIASDYKYLNIYKEDLNFFKDKEERDLASEIDYFHKGNNNANFADFLNYINKNEILNIRVMEIMKVCAEEDLEHLRFVDYLKMMKMKLNEEEIKELKEKIKSELDVDKKVKLIERLTKIKKGSVDYE